jgi:amino acid transporter
MAEQGDDDRARTGAVTTPVAADGTAPSAHTHVPLQRVLHVFGTLAIVVSAVTPAASVFIIAPVAFTTVGTGAFWAFAIAAVIGIGVAYSYSELGAAFPIAGGDYAIISRIFGKQVGFLSLVLWILLAVFIPSSIALGIGTYLSVVWNADANVLGAGVMVIATVIAVLNIRTNAKITGVFLAIEMVALVIVTVLGLVHAHNSIGTLFSPKLYPAHGAATAASFGVILSGVAIAIFSYNGYGAAINFSEEITGHKSEIAKAILWSLLITVLAEFIPVCATLLGAPSLHALSNSAAPMTYLLTSLSGSTLNTIVSLGISLAILNATLAIILELARIVFSAARDRAFPGPMNKALAHVHPKLQTPWVATIVVGACGAVLTGLSNVAALVSFTGVVLTINYLAITIAAVYDRWRNPGRDRPYRMPVWPFWPLVAIVGCVAVLFKQTGHNEGIVAMVLGGAVLYYLLVLWPLRKTHWILYDPNDAPAEREQA